MAGYIEEPMASIAETGCRLCAYAPPSAALPPARRHSLLASRPSNNEGDNNYDTTTELDEVEVPGWRGAFSAQWDPNNPRQLYICSQNGLLKVVDVESSKEKTFQVLFRAFSASVITSGQGECKPLRYHWDKMSIVHGKPGEFFFLMGVSNTVYFTALPGSPSSLASLTNADMPDFVNGSPILQIYSHTARVTAMASCPLAEVFVSGDESGRLHIINFIPDPTNKLQSEWWSQPTATPSHTNPIARPHNAPIFSLAWLPLVHLEKNRDRILYLATGSEDRMVKLWKVTCTLQKNVTIAPLMVLDTISTHMLCLTCLSHYRDAKDQGLQPKPKVPSANNSYVDENATVNRSIVSFITQAVPQKSYNDLYIAGGTSAGSVYVWRIQASDINSRFESVNASIDEGTRLVAIVDCSERPVVHLSMYYRCYEDGDNASVFGGGGARSGRKTGGSQASLDSVRSRGKSYRMVLSASDTSSIVRLYVHQQPEAKISKFLQTTAVKAGSGLSRVPFGSKSTDEATPKSDRPEDIEGLVLMGEAQLQEPVVGCLFAPDVDTPASLEDQLEGRQVDKSDSLVVCLASGEVRFYSNRSLLTPKLGSVLDDLPEDDDDSSVGEVAVQERVQEIAKRRASLVPQQHQQQEQSFLPQQQSSSQYMSNTEDSGSDEDVRPKKTPSASNAIPREVFNTTSSSNNISSQAFMNQPQIAKESFKEQLVPRPSSSTMSRVFESSPVPVEGGFGAATTRQSVSKKVSVSEAPAEQMRSPERNRDTTTTSSRSPVESPTRRSKLIKETKLEPSVPLLPLRQSLLAPTAASKAGSLPTNPASTAAAVAASAMTMSAGAAGGGDVPPSLQAVRNLKHHKKGQGANSSQMPTSELADPTVHSSKVLAEKYKSMVNALKLASNGSTVGDEESIVTTLSQRQLAANVATNVPPSTHKAYGVYSDLISIDSEALLKHMPPQVVVPKQVDPEWLRRRRTEGPTGKELAVLYTKDVTVMVRLEGKGRSSSDAATATEGVVRAVDSHGLSATMDKSTLEFTYTLSVDPVELFDKPSSYLTSTGKESRQLPCWSEIDELNDDLDEAVFI